MKDPTGPTLKCVLETTLYVEDIERSIYFYQNVMRLEPIHHIPHLCAFSVGGINVLLIFQRESTSVSVETEGGIIPSHSGYGSLHMAFAIIKEELQDWKQRLNEYQVAILSEVKWPRGGTSLYFRDPDEHLIELATPGLWSIY